MSTQVDRTAWRAQLRAEAAEVVRQRQDAPVSDLTPDPLPLRSIPVPAEVTRVEGCDCGGLEWHGAGCSLWSLPCEDQMAAIDAAEARLAAHTADLNARLRQACPRL